MKLGIMQPYFFPYLGYFSLIKNTDEWIVFDEVQFIRHGWIERNRILKPADGWQYISVPLEKHPRETKIADIQIRTGEDWRNKIFRQIEHYKKAPHYVAVVELISEALNVDTKSIVELNVRILQTICAYLSVRFNFSIFSDINLKIEPVTHPGEWAINISKALKAGEYINPIGGMEIFNPEQFRRNGINLVFLKNTLPAYNQRRKQFEAGLSIIDVLMFNDVAQTNALIDSVEYIRD
jgi:hypothetical protein